MLVISQRRSEKVYLEVPPSDQPTLIELVVVEARGSWASLGFVAPRTVLINRDTPPESVPARKAGA